MKLHYELKCIDEDNGEVVAQISSYSEESLTEDWGKRKWVETIKRYEDEQKSPERFNIEDRPVNERLQDESREEMENNL